MCFEITVMHFLLSVMPGSVLYWWVWQNGPKRSSCDSRSNGTANDINHESWS